MRYGRYKQFHFFRVWCGCSGRLSGVNAQEDTRTSDAIDAHIAAFLKRYAQVHITRASDAIDADIAAFMKRRNSSLADLQEIAPRDTQEKKRLLIEHLDHIDEELLRLVEEGIRVTGGLHPPPCSSPPIVHVTDEGLSEVYAIDR